MGAVTVLGIGNVLMGDDAVGPYVVKVLAAGYAFPRGVRLLDAGTPGPDLPVFIEGSGLLVVVDAAGGGAPGTVRLLGAKDILRGAPVPLVGPHEPGLREALLRLSFTGTGPRDVHLVAVAPGRVETGVGLSPEVMAAVPRAEAMVLEILGRGGVRTVRREVPRVPDIWWER